MSLVLLEAILYCTVGRVRSRTIFYSILQGMIMEDPRGNAFVCLFPEKRSKRIEHFRLTEILSIQCYIIIMMMIRMVSDYEMGE